MGILDNFESAWDQEFQFESKPIIHKNNLGDPIIQGTQESDEFCLDEEVIDN